jgi:alpha-beta hydrolase superfamily lysophospholipase
MLEAGRWSLANADRLNRPLLLMHGTEDRITSCEASREFANKSQDWCTLMLWDGLFHDLHDEPERLDVLASVIDWMRKLCG